MTDRWQATVPSGPYRRARAAARKVKRRARRRYGHAIADVCLVSYPKCGRTWLRYMIGAAIDRHFAMGATDPTDLAWLARMNPAVPYIRVTHDDQPQWKRPEAIETDKARYRRKKVVFLVRDPRDVVVSEYFHKSRRRGVESGSLSEFLRADVGSIGSIIRFYNVWAANRHVPRRFHLVRYEDLHRHAAGELRQVLDVLGLGVIPDGVVSDAVEAGRFSAMRRLESASNQPTSRLRPADPDDPESFKVRRGEVGGFRHYLEEDEADALTELLERELDPIFGYPTR